MTTYPGQTLTRTTLGQLWATLWDQCLIPLRQSGALLRPHGLPWPERISQHHPSVCPACHPSTSIALSTPNHKGQVTEMNQRPPIQVVVHEQQQLLSEVLLEQTFPMRPNRSHTLSKYFHPWGVELLEQCSLPEDGLLQPLRSIQSI